VPYDWSAIATGSHGNLFVADDFNDRVEKRASGGEVMTRWSLKAIPPDLTVGPSGIAVDKNGSIYVSDSRQGRILKLSSSGKLLTQWGAGGAQPGRFWFPGSVALDGKGRLWVDDAFNNRVQILTTGGLFQSQLAVPNAGPALALDRRGNIYISQLIGHVVYISKFSPAGTLLGRWGHFHLGELPTGIAVAPNDDIYVLGVFYFPLSKGTSSQPDGTYILRLGPNGSRLTMFQVQTDTIRGGIAVDAQGNTYIVYGAAPRISKRAPDGHVLASTGIVSPQDFTYGTRSVTLDSAGTLYVTETGKSMIQRFSPGLAVLDTYGFPGSYSGQFHHPGGIAVDTAGNIYVSDTDNHRIQRFNH